jgi:hypothetical protein
MPENGGHIGPQHRSSEGQPKTQDKSEYKLRNGPQCSLLGSRIDHGVFRTAPVTLLESPKEMAHNRWKGCTPFVGGLWYSNVERDSWFQAHDHNKREQYH